MSENAITKGINRRIMVIRSEKRRKAIEKSAIFIAIPILLGMLFQVSLIVVAPKLPWLTIYSIDVAFSAALMALFVWEAIEFIFQLFLERK